MNRFDYHPAWPVSRGRDEMRDIPLEYMNKPKPGSSTVGDSLLIGAGTGGMVRYATGYKRKAEFQDSFLKTLGRNLLTYGGGAAGGAIGGGLGLSWLNPVAGATAGGALGSAIGGSISRIAGMGAYNVRVNTIAHGVPEGKTIPAFGNMAHATIVRHREYITDVVCPATPTAFNNTSYSLNPGLNTTFPWMAQLAASYDQYQIRGMVFEFKAMSSDYAGTTAMGTVILATNYDATDANYTSKLIMENSQYCVSDKPSRDQVHAIECDPAVSFSPIKYNRTGGIAAGRDPRLYDHGVFQIATQGLSATAGQVIGELWVTYEVALFKPNLINVIPNSGIILVDHFDLSTAVSASNYLGPDTTTTVNAATGSSLGGTIKNSTYSFPAAISSGNFILRYTVFGAATTITNAMANTANVNLVGLNMFNQVGTDTASYASPASGSLINTNTNFTLAVTVTAPGASITLGTGTLPSSVTGGDLFVQSIGLVADS